MRTFASWFDLELEDKIVVLSISNSLLLWFVRIQKPHRQYTKYYTQQPRLNQLLRRWLVFSAWPIYLRHHLPAAAEHANAERNIYGLKRSMQRE